MRTFKPIRIFSRVRAYGIEQFYIPEKNNLAPPSISMRPIIAFRERHALGATWPPASVLNRCTYSIYELILQVTWLIPTDKIVLSNIKMR